LKGNGGKNTIKPIGEKEKRSKRERSPKKQEKQVKEKELEVLEGTERKRLRRKVQQVKDEERRERCRKGKNGITSTLVKRGGTHPQKRGLELNMEGLGKRKVHVRGATMAPELSKQKKGKQPGGEKKKLIREVRKRG